MIKRKHIGKFLKKENPACVCLQETHLREGEGKWLMQVFQGRIFHASSQSRSKRVMIGIAEDVPWVSKEIILNKVGRYVILKGTWDKRSQNIVGIYALHKQQGEFWNDVFELVGQKEDAEIVLLGNFNATINNTMDRSQNSKSLELPKSFKVHIDTFQLVDI